MPRHHYYYVELCRPRILIFS